MNETLLLGRMEICANKIKEKIKKKLLKKNYEKILILL
jgi:hypothetical protein